MNWKKQIKAANSKGALIKHIAQLQRALLYYCDENNWAVNDSEEIQWLGISDPTYVANRLLGKVKLDKGLEEELMKAATNQQKIVSGSRTESTESDGQKN